jgi:hypothetical protein
MMTSGHSPHVVLCLVSSRKGEGPSSPVSHLSYSELGNMISWKVPSGP